eukprot:151182_1
MRTNGLEGPHNGMQISTWVLYPTLVAQFCLFLTPNLPLLISAPVTVLFICFGLGSLYYGYTTTKTDSIDTKLYQQLNNRPHPRAEAKEEKKRKKIAKQLANKLQDKGNNNDPEGVSVRTGGEHQNLNENEDEEEEKTKYCWVCQTNVYENSMHCKYCDKCVSTFDHHCMWLNNCIGDANYGYFYRTVWFTTLFILSHAVTLVIYLGMYFGGNARTKELSQNWLGANLPELVVGFNIGFLVLTGAAALLVMQLLFFHLGLRREGITTYGFIIRDGQRKRENWQFKQKVQSRRRVEGQRAADEGKCVEACWVRLGAKYCTLCDPIVPMVREDIARLEQQAVDHDDSSHENLAEDEKKSEQDMRPTSSGNMTIKTEGTR